MRKILIFAAVVVLLLSGCVDKKEAQTDAPQQGETLDSSEPQTQQSGEQQSAEQSGEQSGEQGGEQQASEGETTSTEETLQELDNLLEELKDIDFADVDFAE